MKKYILLIACLTFNMIFSMYDEQHGATPSAPPFASLNEYSHTDSYNSTHNTQPIRYPVTQDYSYLYHHNSQDNSATSNVGTVNNISLCQAIKNRDAKEIKRILSNAHYDITQETTDNGNTALHEAVSIWNEGLIIRLISKGLSIYKRNNDGHSPYDLIAGDSDKEAFLRSAAIDQANISRRDNSKIKAQPHIEDQSPSNCPRDNTNNNSSKIEPVNTNNIKLSNLLLIGSISFISFYLIFKLLEKDKNKPNK